MMLRYSGGVQFEGNAQPHTVGANKNIYVVLPSYEASFYSHNYSYAPIGWASMRLLCCEKVRTYQDTLPLSSS